MGFKSRLLGFATLLLSVVSLYGTSKPHSETTQDVESAQSIARDRYVVVVVWDGMRPDFVSAQNTPTLWRLAREGVVFRSHHSVYPTATDVNGAAIATGAYPARNGLVANREYRPAIDSRQPFENAEPEIITKCDQVTGGHYLALPTIAEMIRSAGGSAAIAGTKGVTFLHDRNNDWSSGATKNSITRFAGAPMPPNIREEAVRLLGPFLTEHGNTSERNTYAACVLTEILWHNWVPEFSLLWLSDPDLTQHEYSPGAPQSMAAIRGSDRNLSIVLDTLETKKIRDKTDVFIVSDHGFSTIERGIDFPAVLREAGFDAVASLQEAPKAGQIIVAENGGTMLFYIVDHDRSVAERLIEWLQHGDYAGVIFTREKFEGTFPLEAGRLNTPDAPDVIVALRWQNSRNRFGIPGQIVTDATRKSGQGSHASLSEFDVHNTLIAAGPHFRRGITTDVPSGNIDLAPTILHLLGIRPTQKLDGRVLTEGLIQTSAQLHTVTDTLHADRKFPAGQWHQYLKISQVEGTTYIDEGNGRFDVP